MGLLNKFKQKLGSAISKVGEFLNSPAIAKVGAKLEGRRSTVVETIGTSKAVNPKRDSIRESQRVNDVLATYAQSIKNDSSELEKAISKSLDQMHDILEKMSSNSIIRNRLNLDYSSAKNNAKDIFSTYISRRMSAADSECAEIMRMRPSKAKSQKMDAFSKQVVKEGARAASESIKAVLRTQNQQLKKEYECRSDTEMALLKQNQKEIERIRNERLNLSNTQLNTQYRSSAIIEEANAIKQTLMPTS